MPYLLVRTNHAVSTDHQQTFASKASKTVADLLGKPEKYVMTTFEISPIMTFAGSSEPCAYMELKSIGLPADNTAGYSKALCRLVETELGIPAKRIYIEFADAARNMWGWNSGTF